MQRWDEIVILFERALDRPPAEREAFVAHAAGDDADLRERVLDMLRADAAHSPLLDADPATLADAVADPALIGRVIGPYRIIREIGRGGMGTVWLAERDDVGKRVALKLVAGWLGTPERTARFLFERRVLARLEHPNIAKLLDAGIADDGTPWLAMEYIDGRPLNEYCADRGIDVRGRLRLFADACSAVAYAHRNLVVHRDLKPANLLVTADGELRLVDFGIAKLVAGDGDTDGLTRAGTGPFTPDYASPEQASGRAITTASDVYQLGVLLYELLAGRRPRDFSGLRPHEIARRLETQHVPPPSAVAPAEIRGSVKGDLDTIVQLAMQPEPERRYASAGDLGDDVRRYLDGRPIRARPATFGYRARKFVYRHRVGSAMIAALLVVIITSAAALAVQARRTAIERDRAEQVADVLVDLFASANPNIARGDTITVRAVLDRGADRIRSDLTADPRVRARVLDAIATTYRSLGAQERAIELQNEALATLRTTLPPRHPELIEALRVQAVWRIEAGDAANALPLLDEALSLLPDRPRRRFDRARLIHAYGFAHQVGGNAAAARPLYEDAAAIFRTGPDSLATWLESTLVNLGFIAQTDGDLATADSLFREVLDRRALRLGRDDPQTASTRVALANVARTRGNLDDAERHAIDALASIQAVYTEPHQLLAEALSARAHVFAARAQHDRAESMQRQSIDAFTAVYGRSHRSTARAVSDLAVMIQERGRVDEAAGLFRDAADMYTRALGERNAITAAARTNLAYAEFARGRIDDAVPLYARAVPVLDSAWTGTSRLAQILVDYGLALNESGQCVAAEPLLRRALAIEQRNWPPEHVRVIRTERTLGTCLVNLRRFAEAEPLLIEAHRKLVELEGPDGFWAAAAGRDLATLYRLWDRPAEAARVGSDR